MTRRDYVEFAKVFKDSYQVQPGYLSSDPLSEKRSMTLVIDRLREGVEMVLARDNPRFDLARFRAACQADKEKAQ
jgi:hypothetical protein